VTTRLKLALVGCGAIARLHLPAIRGGAPRTDVTATVDTDLARAEALAKETGARAFGSLDDALAHGDFDAVDLMLPHDVHETATLAALAAGKHVLLEKPIAPTVEASERILAAGRRSGRILMVAENAQYWPEVVTAKRLLDDGAIGNLIAARGTFVIPLLPMFYGGDRPWRLESKIAGGGIAIDAASHWLRPLSMWLGEVDEVVATLARPFAAMEGESLVQSMLRYRSGVVAVFESRLYDSPHGDEPQFRLTGTRGEITIERPGRVMLWDASHPEGTQVGEIGGYVRSYFGEMADFEAAVLDGRPLAAGPEAALSELRIALAMYRSAASGRWEKV
jgi:predicted dehydrogenase